MSIMPEQTLAAPFENVARPWQTQTRTIIDPILCPMCEARGKKMFDKEGYDICHCARCDHMFADYAPPADHVRRVYRDEYFFGGGDGYPNYLAEGKILRAHGQRYGRMLARHMQPGALLDIGSAAGFVLQGLQDCGWKGKGLEPNARMVSYAREQLSLAVKVGALEQYETAERFDLITMIQVISHFNDLASALRSAARLTKPGGYWLIETWNRASFVARMFGEQWHEFSPPSVLHWFSPESLQRMLAPYGLREVASGRPSKWISAAHAKTLLQHKLQSGGAGKVLVRMFDAIPESAALPYPAFDLFWGLYRKENV